MITSDHLDVWLLHGKSSAQDITNELLDALHTARRQGKVRFNGVGTHNLPAIPDRVIEAMLDVVQAQYKFASDPSSGPAIEKLAQAGVGLVAMKVMARARRGRGAAAQPQPQRPAAFPEAALKWALKSPAFATTVPFGQDQAVLHGVYYALTQ